MAPRYNVFWKNTADFRVFDISAPSISFANELYRSISTYYGSDPLADELRLNDGGGGANNAFYSNFLTVSGQTILSGTIQRFVDWSNYNTGNYNGYIEPSGAVSIPMLNAAIDSASTTDDAQILRQMLSGDDAMQLSGGYTSGITTHDFVFAAAGQDTISGNRGNDTLFGDSGNDYVFGDQDNDSVFGGAGADYIDGDVGTDNVFGGKGNDQLYGGKGSDFLTGGTGTDMLYGGAGADQFTFRSGAGTDYIKDWQDGVDKIRLEAPGGNSIRIEANYSGGDATVRFFNMTTGSYLNITLNIENVAANSLTSAGDFVIVPI